LDLFSHARAGSFLYGMGSRPAAGRSFVGRLPAGRYILMGLNQLDLIISPRDEQHAKKLLQKCYMEIHDLFNDIVLEEDVNKYIKRCYEILAAQSKLIENELGEVARVKFLDRAGFFPKAVGNKIYNQLLLELNRIKDNLEELIKSETYK
jgi:hypothetical protein